MMVIGIALMGFLIFMSVMDGSIVAAIVFFGVAVVLYRVVGAIHTKLADEILEKKLYKKYLKRQKQNS